MRLSANTRYAIRVLFELNGMPGPVATAFLAEKTGMTLRTVENIHTILRRAGITAGTVGAKGGIALVAPLETISLGRLVALFDDGVEFAVCCGDKSNDCPNQSGCGIREIWKGVSHDVQSRLDAISLATILQRYPTGPHGVILDAVYPDDAAFPGDMLRAPVCREYGRMTARPMRRKDRALPAAAAWELLEKGEYGFLVTVGADGLPYGVPLSYVLLEGGVYFHSARDGRKIDNILFCRDVSLTVVGDTEPVYV
ncbi:MAG: Rrf2 family transcriptional regulator, partial [Deltaproteobacteria bacterium]|nr:Rrf2 family transcriptional regulator [Deltaproteobacteria bacterium]